MSLGTIWRCVNVYCVLLSPCSISVIRGQTGTFTFNMSDIDSSSMTFDIDVLQRQQIPTPSSMTLIYPSGEVNVLDFTQSPLAVIPNPNMGEIIQATLTWSPALTLPDGSIVLNFQLLIAV